ncbi:MAG TPA: ATP-binding protein [Thermoanaerobaculia bacterium]
MTDLPTSVTASLLWRRMSGHLNLVHGLSELRETASAVAAKAETVVPDFTDHSVKHMDALWEITQVVLTAEEIERITPAEAFILGSSFYVHDLGMAVGATAEGRALLEASDAFNNALSHLKGLQKVSHLVARESAFKIASRELHAKLAESFVDERVPGLDRHLIQSLEVRRQWGAMIGQVAASHHWSLRVLDSRLGKRGVVPGPATDVGMIDLGFVACALRIIDFAHINFGRARLLDRVLRSSISPESLIHWQAQEHISGPIREGSQLVYASTRPVESADGWWLFYDLVRGLESEIEAVAEYLSERKASEGRFSLKGVKGIASARQFAALVETSGFEPIDIRFRPDSLDRLIQLLGGRTLYGNDIFAPLREVLQNATDAVRLRWAGEISAGLKQGFGEINIELEREGDSTYLVVSDDGVGMSERVVTNYLLGIASDYWHSPDFYADHPKVLEGGFQPVGRFGIGFLSVFMIGDEVQVETQKQGGGEALQLTLRGVGRRGLLVRRPTRLRAGTTVRVRMSPEHTSEYAGVHRVVQARAPMLDAPVVISEGGTVTRIEPGWWKAVSQEEFASFIQQQLFAVSELRNRDKDSAYYELAISYRHQARLLDARATSELERWPGKQPEVIGENYRFLALPTRSSLLLCSKGFAVQTYPLGGFVGIIDEPDLQLSAARDMPLQWDASSVKEKLINELTPHIQSAVDALQQEPNIPLRYGFLVAVANAYGMHYLANTTLGWITVVSPPGRADLLSPGELRDRMRGVDEVVIGYNTDPWSIANYSRSHFADAPQRVLMIPISSKSQLEVRGGESYEKRQQVLNGPLPDHFKGSLLGGPIFLNVVLDVIADAWSIDRAQLTLGRWSSRQDILCGYLKR